MKRPLLLDLFCGAGGCAMGYHRAGFDVVGVDIKPQPRYPFDFIRGDALEYGLTIARENNGVYDAIHASPPCQQYSPLKALQQGKTYPDHIAATRELLQKTGLQYVIENVPGAPMFKSIVLCGGMFGLRTYRHRWFECNFMVMQLEHPRHVAKTSTKKRRACFDAGLHISVTGDVGSYVGPACMGIDWMTGNELSQAIPPAYTEYIGRQLLRAISATCGGGR